MSHHDPRLSIGGNRPPPYDADTLAAFDAESAKFLDGAVAWLEAGEIKDEDGAARLNDFIAGVKKRLKAADEMRKAEKKPHDDAGKAVQAAYKPVLDKLDRAVAKVSPLLTAWMTAQEEKRQAEARRRAEEAEAARAAAEAAAAKAAEKSDIAAEIEAEAALTRAEEAQKEAARFAKGRTQVSSATGGGRTASLRTQKVVTVKNLRVLFMHYADHPVVAECLQKLAAADVRGGAADIPGIEITEEKRAV